MSSTAELIAKMIDEEVERKVQERMETYMEHISKHYGISMKSLLNDLNNFSGQPSSTKCMGVKKNGKRCTKSSNNGNHGYCTLHVSQYTPKPQAIVCKPVSNDIPVHTHTHTIPPLFDKNCPACTKVTFKKNPTPLNKILIA